MKEKMISLIEETLDLKPGTITEETLVADVEEWDSLAHILIIGQLEDKLGLSIPVEKALTVKSVKELLDAAGI